MQKKTRLSNVFALAGHRIAKKFAWTIGIATIGLASHVSAARADEIPTPPGWTLAWSDNFDGPAGTLPSSKLWRFDTGHSYPNGAPNWGTSETESYTDDPRNIHLDGQGHLLIIPQRDAGGQWTSARIESVQDNFTAPDGGMLRIEARIQMPNVAGDQALGYWPAFWALGSSFRNTMAWPQAGEFDIMESVNGLDSVWGILHCGVNPGGPCAEPQGIGSRLPCPHISCTGAFHTYTFEWNRSVTPERLRWFVDGVQINQVTENQLSPGVWHDLTTQQGYFVLLDVAMGGGFSFVMAGWHPTPTVTTEPGHAMMVDYVAVWTRAGNGQKVPATPEMTAGSTGAAPAKATKATAPR
jgi:hypothetical protein